MFGKFILLIFERKMIQETLYVKTKHFNAMKGILYRIVNKKRSSLYKRQYYYLLVMLHLVYILYHLFYSGGLPALSYAILFATTLLRANYLSNNSTTAPITVFGL